jgi:hypothetical protein
MSDVITGTSLFLAKPRSAEDYVAFIRELDRDLKEKSTKHAKEIGRINRQLIAAQESEAVWKTERDKADQRRLEAEARCAQLEDQISFATALNRREIIAAQVLAGMYSNSAAMTGRPEEFIYGAVCAADGLIAALDSRKEVK